VFRFLARTFAASCAAAAVLGAPGPARAETSVRVPVLAPAQRADLVSELRAHGASLALATDFTYRRSAAEPTQVFVAQDRSALYVTFVATQKEPITASQLTNSGSALNDDNVTVYLWPQGANGFAYSFTATPRGTRYQTSSENSAYTPQWTASGAVTDAGYTVTMRIPFDVIRSGGSKDWRAQFARQTVSTNSLTAWTFSERQVVVNDPAFAGMLGGVGITQAELRPKARAQLYGLREWAPAAAGGDTARVGADFSIPVAPTASLVGTIHPDYSNVEVDQQTIAPSAFAHQFQEVRPFFTQAGSAFNRVFGCSDCPLLLYTPAIPTFREGYALEGTSGPLTYAAFDAIGDRRSDQGQTLDYSVKTPATSYSVNLQRSTVDAAQYGLHDQTVSLTTGVHNQRTHLFAYANAAAERGSYVTRPGEATYLEVGTGYSSATSGVILNYQKIGSQFNPPDAFVPQSDITGYEAFGRRTINFSPSAPVHDVLATVFAARYHDRFGQPDQIDLSEAVTVDFRNLVSLKVDGNFTAVRTIAGELLPFDRNGFTLGYRIQTVTPSFVQYAGGPYFHGHLNSWSYVATLPVRRRINLHFEGDVNDYATRYPGEIPAKQWLERAAVDWQMSRDGSLDIGLRRIIGRDLPFAFAPPAFTYRDASNVSAAYHFLALKNEFYLVYGDPNSFSTTPALFLKWIRYVGAPKGT
jgi:hypothetical protein